MGEGPRILIEEWSWRWDLDGVVGGEVGIIWGERGQSSEVGIKTGF